jgi:hypothetical protein
VATKSSLSLFESTIEENQKVQWLCISRSVNCKLLLKVYFLSHASNKM